MRPLTWNRVVMTVFGWSDDDHRRQAATLDAIGEGAETLLEYGMNTDDNADGIAEHWPELIHEIEVDIENSDLDIRIDPGLFRNDGKDS